MNKNTGYLARMIDEVQGSMSVFMVIYMISHLAFAQGFYFISLASKKKKYQFATSYLTAIQYSFFTALGEYSYYPQFEDSRNSMRWLGMGLFMLCCVLTTVVMLNLLIAIISDKYNEVSAMAHLYMY